MGAERGAFLVTQLRRFGRWLVGLVRRRPTEHRIGVVGPEAAAGHAVIAEIQGRETPLPVHGGSFKYHDPVTQIPWELVSLDPGSPKAPNCQLVLCWISYQQARATDMLAGLALDNPQLLAQASNTLVARVGLVIRDFPSELTRDPSQAAIVIRRTRAHVGVAGCITEKLARAKGCPGDPLADCALASALSQVLASPAFSSLLEALHGRKRELTLFLASPRGKASEAIRRWISSGPKFEPARPPLIRFAVAAVLALSAGVTGFLALSFPAQSGPLERKDFAAARAQFEQRWEQWNASWAGRLAGAIELELPEQTAPQSDCSEPLHLQVQKLNDSALVASSAIDCARSIQAVVDEWYPNPCSLEFSSRFNEESLASAVRCAVLAKSRRPESEHAGLPSEESLFGLVTAPEGRAAVEALVQHFERTESRKEVEALLAAADLRQLAESLGPMSEKHAGPDLARLTVPLGSVVESVERMTIDEVYENHEKLYGIEESARGIAALHPVLVDGPGLNRLGSLVTRAKKCLGEDEKTIEIEGPPGSDWHIHARQQGGWSGARNAPGGGKLSDAAVLAYGGKYSVLVDRSSSVHFGPVPSPHDKKITVRLDKARVTEDNFSFSVVGGMPVWEAE